MAHTSNDEIQDAMLRHQIGLLRFSKGLAARVVALLNRAEPELRARLNARLERIAHLGWDPGPATTKRMIKTSLLIAEINRPTFKGINEQIRKELVALAVGETKFTANLIQDSLPVVATLALPTARELRGIVFARPFERNILRDWLSTYELGDRRRMMGEIRQGLVFNETPRAISQRIFGTRALGGADGVRQITRRGALTLANTAMAAITNGVRSELFKKNKRFIKRESYNATLDSRTTAICSSLDGDIFKVGEGPHPPLHINCRSQRIPVIEGRALGSRPFTTATQRQLGDLKGPSRRRAIDKLVGKVPADTNYTEWLRSQRFPSNEYRPSTNTKSRYSDY